MARPLALAQLSPLAHALEEIAAALRNAGTPFMVIGGIAVLIWGEPRTTQDIDVVVSIPDDERLPAFLASVRSRLSPLPEDPIAFLRETHVLPVMTLSGVRADLIWAGIPFEEQAIKRAVVRQLGTNELPVCTPEDLIVLKLASTRARDREDVEGVIGRQASSLDRAYLDPLARSLSEALEQPEILRDYLRLIGR